MLYEFPYEFDWADIYDAVYAGLTHNLAFSKRLRTAAYA